MPGYVYRMCAVHGRGMAHTSQTTFVQLCLLQTHPTVSQLLDLFEGEGNMDLARPPAHVGAQGHGLLLRIGECGVLPFLCSSFLPMLALLMQMELSIFLPLDLDDSHDTIAVDMCIAAQLSVGFTVPTWLVPLPFALLPGSGSFQGIFHRARDRPVCAKRPSLIIGHRILLCCVGSVSARIGASSSDGPDRVFRLIVSRIFVRNGPPCMYPRGISPRTLRQPWTRPRRATKWPRSWPWTR